MKLPNFKDPESIRRIIWCVFLLIPICLGIWLLDKNFALRGVSVVSMNLAKLPRGIGEIHPPERVSYQSDDEVAVMGVPVYLSIPRNRTFDSAHVSVRFRPNDTPVIEMGAVLSYDPWSVRTIPLYNRFLEDMRWKKIQSNRMTLWQREQKFSSVQEFLKNIPSLNSIASSGIELPRNVIIDNYVPSQEVLSYPLSLRGDHSLFTYLGSGEVLDFKFLFQDVNRHDGEDAIKVQLLDARGKILETISGSDDGEVWDSNKTSKPVIIALSKELPQGVYEIRIIASDDIMMRMLTTRQSKLVFRRQLYLGDEVGWSKSTAVKPRFALTAAGSTFGFFTPHPQGRQTVHIGAHQIMVDKEMSRFDFNIPIGEAWKPRALNVSNDLEIVTDGYIALTPQGFFLPETISAMSRFDPDALGINYVIAQYESPYPDGSFLVAQNTLPIYDVSDPGELSLLLGSPAIGTNGFSVARIVVRMQRRVDIVGDCKKIVKYATMRFERIFSYD